MALDLDGFETWRAIANQPALFAPLKAPAAKAARSLIVRYLKSRTLDLPQIGSIREALGTDTFGLILDGMTDSEVKALVTRFDSHNRAARTASAQWRRRHFAALVRREIEPAAKPPSVKRAGRARKAAGNSKPRSGEPWFASAGAVRKR